jgi:hypothetical protein
MARTLLGIMSRGQRNHGSSSNWVMTFQPGRGHVSCFGSSKRLSFERAGVAPSGTWFAAGMMTTWLASGWTAEQLRELPPSSSTIILTRCVTPYHRPAKITPNAMTRNRDFCSVTPIFFFLLQYYFWIISSFSVRLYVQVFRKPTRQTPLHSWSVFLGLQFTSFHLEESYLNKLQHFEVLGRWPVCPVSPNIGPLISRWELHKFKNCWNKNFRTSKILTLLYQQFLNLLIYQHDMSGPRLGALSNNRWSGGI